MSYDPWLTPILLLVLGLVIGCFGTMIGAGGGFILVPILLFLYPDDQPEVITAISLAVVFCNAASGSFAYARKKRIDYRSAVSFALISLPGSVMGVFATRWIARKTFDPVFGLGLVLVGVYLMLKKTSPAGLASAGVGNTTRELTDSEGNVYRYTFDMRIGLAISAAVGFLSSFLGIGGGIIHVPALVHLLGFPVHLATATSHLILAIMALCATLQHYLNGSLTPGWWRLLFLAPGVMLGAPIGAQLSERVRGTWILRALAFALLVVGLRLVISSWV